VPDPVFGPHLRATVRHARARGGAARGSGGSSISLATMLSLLPAGCALVGAGLALAGHGVTRDVGIGLLAAYGVLIASSALLAAVRFRSLTVGLLAAPALIATHAAYVGGFVQGLLRSR